MQLVRFETRQEFDQAVADALADFLRAKSDRPAAAMLAGGETPMAGYRLLNERKPGITPGRRLILSDERMAPLSSNESNRGNTGRALEALESLAECFLDVRVDLSLDAAAEQFDADLRAFLEGGGQMELGFLGLGTDGHTASLFSLEDAAIDDGRLAIGVRRASGPDRVSVTRSLLRHFSRLVFLAAGDGKADVVARFLESPLSLPAGRAVAGFGAVEIWVQ